ncbi:flagellar protein FlgN [Aquisalimonas lutea]|uniref:flagella synthesis protein FlgN n=1 Tax=Aquisalimonas lutea TaxID=1327750 RepID=UPI0025B4E078|nr:flagellar protein FlgN [Aquisalimonas lutea]MDN3517976.1 flagellar protein FlgN [Aquisalimonas lutea]
MTDPRSDLDQLLHDQLERLEALNQLLQDEQTALVARDMEALPGLLSRKVELLGAVEADEQRRVQLAAAIGDDHGEAGMEACLERMPDPDAARRRWHDLVEALRQCRALNDANGRVIQKQQTGVQRTMELLQEDTSASSAYGPDNASEPSPGGGREISRA